MARGTYTVTPAVKALRELITFAEQPDQGGALPVLGLGQGMVRTEVWSEMLEMSPARRQALAAEVRRFLHAAAGDPGISYVDTAEVRVALIALLPEKRRRRGTARLFAVRGTPRDVVLYQAMTLLETVGTERLRLCPAPDCGRVFLKIGRRDFCSETCQRRVYLTNYDAFAARPRRKDQHGKTTR